MSTAGYAMPTDSEIITNNSVERMCANYRDAVARSQAAARELAECKQLMETTFGRHCPALDGTERREKVARAAAWHGIVTKMGARRLWSNRRAAEVDRMLDPLQSDIPDLTEENIYALLKQTAESADGYLEELVMEVYAIARPERSTLKTNQKNVREGLDKKVILTYCVREGWPKGRFRISYSQRAEREVNAFDRVFRALDGKTTPDENGYHGQLRRALEASPDGTGKTDYFEFRACKNGNLHLTFLRPDLVMKFNKVAGSAILKG